MSQIFGTFSKFHQNLFTIQKCPTYEKFIYLHTHYYISVPQHEGDQDEALGVWIDAFSSSDMRSRVFLIFLLIICCRFSGFSLYMLDSTSCWKKEIRLHKAGKTMKCPGSWLCIDFRHISRSDGTQNHHRLWKLHTGLQTLGFCDSLLFIQTLKFDFQIKSKISFHLKRRLDH